MFEIKNDWKIDEIRSIFEMPFNDILFNILGFNSETNKVEKLDSQKELVELLIKIRSQARNDKNFILSDQIRDELLKLGIQLNDDKNSSSFELI